ncbi:MAG TPA: glycosyltransferase, partial [Patescibacteria group bacterium]|nr:glycosyltransferase [Patescibacteria group bacterium]
MTRIDVCIATYKRPALLRKLLQSLANQHLPKDVVLRLIVVDNDARGSARDCVDQMSAVLPIRYMVEPTKGLSFVRNRALSAALE